MYERLFAPDCADSVRRAGGIPFAYRRFGTAGSVPLVFLEYFNSNMDSWDPTVTNSLAADHEVILFDNAGVRASGGNTPEPKPMGG